MNLAANLPLRLINHYANAGDLFARPHLDHILDLDAVALDSLDSKLVFRIIHQPESDAACLKPLADEAAVGVDSRGLEELVDRKTFIRIACGVAQRHDAGMDRYRLKLVSCRGAGALDDHEAADARAQIVLHLYAAHIVARDFKLRHVPRII